MAQMQVFVSHSHKDDIFCRGIVKALRAAGADVWYDEHNLGSGQLGPIIERELRARPVFIVILSPAALASRWVEDETRWAYNRHRRDPSRIILPVLAKPLADPDDIWLFLQEFRRIEAPGTRPYSLAETCKRLISALALSPSGTRPIASTVQPAESLDELLTQGKALIAQKKFAEAMPFLKHATELDPHSVSAWANLGLTYNQAGQTNEALAAYDRALALDSRLAPVWNNKGAALRNLKRYEEALEAYNHALNIDSKLAAAWNNKGNVLRKLNRTEEALAAHDRALDLDPKDALAWNNKGFTLYCLARFDEALTAAEQALTINPQLAVAWDTKGQVLLGLSRQNDALVALDTALALNPKLPDAWHNKADALRALGRTAEAEQAEQRARELGWQG